MSRRIERPQQIPFVFEPRAESKIIYPAPQPSESSSRFVREVPERIQMHTPADAANYLMHQVYSPWEQMDQEQLYTLLLNTRNYITHDALVYKGSIHTIGLRIGEVFKDAVRANAPAIIVSHCHPSGSPEPSPQDIRVSGQLIEAGQLLDIQVVDHIVVGHNQWVSLRERGLAFE